VNHPARAAGAGAAKAVRGMQTRLRTGKTGRSRAPPGSSATPWTRPRRLALFGTRVHHAPRCPLASHSRAWLVPAATATPPLGVILPSQRISNVPLVPEDTQVPDSLGNYWHEGVSLHKLLSRVIPSCQYGLLFGDTSWAGDVTGGESGAHATAFECADYPLRHDGGLGGPGRATRGGPGARGGWLLGGQGAAYSGAGPRPGCGCLLGREGAAD
jgi:hypothetical protein